MKNEFRFAWEAYKHKQFGNAIFMLGYFLLANCIGLYFLLEISAPIGILIVFISSLITIQSLIKTLAFLFTKNRVKQMEYIVILLAATGLVQIFDISDGWIRYRIEDNEKELSYYVPVAQNEFLKFYQSCKLNPKIDRLFGKKRSYIVADKYLRGEFKQNPDNFEFQDVPLVLFPGPNSTPREREEFNDAVNSRTITGCTWKGSDYFRLTKGDSIAGYQQTLAHATQSGIGPAFEKSMRLNLSTSELTARLNTGTQIYKLFGIYILSLSIAVRWCRTSAELGLWHQPEALRRFKKGNWRKYLTAMKIAGSKDAEYL